VLPRVYDRLRGETAYAWEAAVSGSLSHHPQIESQRDSVVSSSPRTEPHGPVPQYLAVLQATIGNQAVGRLVQGADPASGESLEPAFRASAEARLGHDFSGVRVHTGEVAARSARHVDAHAFTVGHDIVLGGGAQPPASAEGQRLLAHELVHVVQQQSAGVVAGRSEAGPDAEREAEAAASAVVRGDAYAVEARTGATIARQPTKLATKSLDEELDEELQKSAAPDPKSLDPNNPHYALTLQGYGYTLTHDGMKLRPEPKNPTARAEWKKRFAKSELLAGRILSQGGPQVNQKEERGQMLASDLAAAGFVGEAMALARQITAPDIREFVYDSALSRPDKIKPAQISEITKFQVGRHALAEHPVLQRLQSGDGSYSKQLTPEQVNAGLAELVKGYEKESALPRELARVLFNDPRIRAGFTKWMIQGRKGALLKAVSEQPFFVEGSRIGTTTGQQVSPSEGTVAWAVANKQNVAVEDILALTSAAQLPIRPPRAFDAVNLRAWLDANTELIGQAIKKQHPNDPDAAEAMLHQITEAFMYHVDVDAPDIKSDKSGKIGHLEAGGPQRSQLKVDCDVLATYNVRLLVSSGFTPVGYMAIVPTNKSRAAHAMAILRHGNDWHLLSNMASRTLPANTTKEEALKMLRDFGIKEAYDSSRPLTGFEILYQDSDAKGTLPAAVLNDDRSALVPALGQ
jgi:Domain of unknown function (DUF4157)